VSEAASDAASCSTGVRMLPSGVRCGRFDCHHPATRGADGGQAGTRHAEDPLPFRSIFGIRRRSAPLASPGCLSVCLFACGWRVAGLRTLLHASCSNMAPSNSATDSHATRSPVRPCDVSPSAALWAAPAWKWGLAIVPLYGAITGVPSIEKVDLNNALGQTRTHEGINQHRDGRCERRSQSDRPSTPPPLIPCAVRIAFLSARVCSLLL